MLNNLKKNIFDLHLNLNIYIYLIISYLLIKNRYFSIIYPYPLNPDEAQMVANSLRIRIHGYNWDSVDGTTSGPLNSLILTWPNLFGWDSTLSSARITASILIILTCIFLYKTILLYSNTTFSLMLTTPIVIFYCLSGSLAFSHYSSEMLPVFCLILANYLILKIYINEKLKYLKLEFFILGIVIGLIPFTKLQAAPIGFIIGLFSLYQIYKTKNLHNFLYFGIGLLAPTLIIILPLFLNNTINDFFMSYLGFASVYIQKALSIIDLYKLIGRDVVLKNIIYFLIAFTFIISLPYINNKLKFYKQDKKLYYYFLFLLISSVYSICRPGNSFLHYLLFLTPFLTLLASYIIYPNYIIIKNIKFFLIYMVVFSYFTFLIGSQNNNNNNKNYKFNSGYKTLIEQKISLKNPEIYSWIPINIKHTLVWAWMPQWYVWSNSTPAVRETNIYNQIVDSKIQQYFKLRFLKDFDKTKPELIIEGTRGKSFGFNDPDKYSPKIFQEFNEILNNKYTIIAPFKLNENCPKLYVKNEYINKINSYIIFPKSVEATGVHSENTSGNNLFDMSVTEDSCSDYWLLPDQTLGSVIIKLEKEESISKIMIMNTKNSITLDRESQNIEVNFFNSNKLIHSERILLNSHPNWNSINVNYKVDEIKINIQSFNGSGAGLNEIIIFRDNN
jgi:hypothetical protein